MSSGEAKCSGEKLLMEIRVRRFPFALCRSNLEPCWSGVERRRGVSSPAFTFIYSPLPHTLHFVF